MQDTPATRSFILVAGISSIIACGILARTHAPPSEDRTPVRPPVRTHVAAPNLPTSAIGHVSLAAIKVAVPGSSGGVTYLPGTDPAAIQYLAKSCAEHARLTYRANPRAVSGTSAARVSSDEIDSIHTPEGELRP